MAAPEVDPDYLALVIDGFVAAVAEASAIISTGDVRDTRELFRHANDLLDILGDAISGSEEALGYVSKLRNMLWTMWSAVGGTPSLH